MNSYMTEAREENSVQRKRLESQQSVVERSLENMRSFFAGQDEVIELKHTAYSRAIFGKGAVSAALYLAGKEAGMYDMSDVIG